VGGDWALEIKNFLDPEMATPPVHKILLMFRRCRERTVTALQKRRPRNSRIFLSPAILPLIARYPVDGVKRASVILSFPPSSVADP
jgi:hypothetical protein